MCYGVLLSPLTSLRVKPRPNKSNVGAICCACLAALLRHVGYCWLKVDHLEPTTPNISQQGGQTHATCCAETFCVEMLRSFGRGFGSTFSYGMRPPRLPDVFICAFPPVPSMISVPIRRVFPRSETDIYSYKKIFIVYKFTSYIKA